jgi:hypothetical protein
MEARALKIELISESGEVLPATVELDHSDWLEGGFQKTRASITIRWSGNQLTGAEWNFFDAMCQVRTQLATLGLTPRCYAACRNLVVSPLAADMGRGEKGYLVEPGKRAKEANLVGIFDSGPDMDLTSVEEQRAFTRQWWRGHGIPLP